MSLMLSPKTQIPQTKAFWLFKHFQLVEKRLFFLSLDLNLIFVKAEALTINETKLLPMKRVGLHVILLSD